MTRRSVEKIQENIEEPKNKNEGFLEVSQFRDNKSRETVNLFKEQQKRDQEASNKEIENLKRIIKNLLDSNNTKVVESNVPSKEIIQEANVQKKGFWNKTFEVVSWPIREVGGIVKDTVEGARKLFKNIIDALIRP